MQGSFGYLFPGDTSGPVSVAAPVAFHAWSPPKAPDTGMVFLGTYIPGPIFPQPPDHRSDPTPGQFIFRYKPSPSSPLKRTRAVYEEIEGSQPVPQAKRVKPLAARRQASLFALLPSELKKEIFSYLTVGELNVATRVSWNWCADSSSDEVWLSQYSRRWKFNPHMNAWFRQYQMTWKAFYWNRAMVEAEYFFQDPDLTDDKCRQFGELLFSEGLSLTTKQSASAHARAAILICVALQELHTAVSIDPENHQNWFVYGDILSRFADMYAEGPKRDVLTKAAKGNLARAKEVLFDVSQLPLESTDLSNSTTSASTTTLPAYDNYMGGQYGVPVESPYEEAQEPANADDEDEDKMDLQ